MGAASGFAPGILTIAICDRCSMKFKYRELKADGNAPGLMVCADCWDSKDPYRLPPRRPEAIVVKNPRPDTDITV